MTKASDSLAALPVGEQARLLATAMAGTGITELTWRTEDHALRLTQATPPAIPSSALPVVAVRSAIPAVFHRRHPLREYEQVTPGEAVATGQVLGFLQAGPLLLPLRAPVAGTLAKLPAPQRALVGYGTELAWIVPDGAP